MVFCRSDAACLCLSCDRNVRSNMGLVCTERTKNLENVDAFPWIASSSASGFNAMICSADQPRALLDSSTHKLGCSGAKDLGICKDNFYEDFRVDDVDLTFENYEELFGTSNNSTEQEQLFGDVGIDSFFETKETPAAKSNSQAEYFAEVPSVGEVKDTLISWGNGASADSLMSNLENRADPNVCFPASQARSSLSLSFSGLTGENSAGDYQDCVVPSAMLMNELPWYPTGSDSSFTAANRDSAVKRYKEKKKNRKFEKKIRYESRKARADVRKRVKGRFVKAGDTYDYDPLCEKRSC